MRTSLKEFPPPMMMANNSQELWVIFDTCILHTEKESRLVRRACQDLVRENKGLADPLIRWFAPQMVVDERRYQMRAAAAKLLPAVRSLAELLGVDLCTEAMVNHSIDDCIARDLHDLDIEVVQLDEDAVDWAKIVEKSVQRTPPFSPDPRYEKGFRDSVILETMRQHIEHSTAKVRKVALVTEDALMQEAAAHLVGDNDLVSIRGSLDELETLINSLRSNVKEEFLNSILDKVSRLFYDPGDDSVEESGIFISEELRLRLEKRCRDELSTRAPGSDSRRNRDWTIGRPLFLKKEDQRVYYQSVVTVEAVCIGTEESIYQSGIGESLIFTGPVVDQSHMLFVPTETGFARAPWLGDSIGVFRDLTVPSARPTTRHRTVEVATGHTQLAVQWSVDVDQDLNLEHAGVDGLEPLGTTWHRSA